MLLPQPTSKSNSKKIASKISVAVLSIPNDEGLVHCSLFQKGDKDAEGSAASLSVDTESDAKDWICRLLEEWRPTYFISEKPSGEIASRFHSFSVGASVAVGSEYCFGQQAEAKGVDEFQTLAIKARKMVAMYLTPLKAKQNGVPNGRQ